jgi:glycerol-3-phosphate dehydrogenase
MTISIIGAGKLGGALAIALNKKSFRLKIWLRGTLKLPKKLRINQSETENSPRQTIFPKSLPT